MQTSQRGEHSTIYRFLIFKSLGLTLLTLLTSSLFRKQILAQGRQGLQGQLQTSQCGFSEEKMILFIYSCFSKVWVWPCWPCWHRYCFKDVYRCKVNKVNRVKCKLFNVNYPRKTNYDLSILWFSKVYVRTCWPCRHPKDVYRCKVNKVNRVKCKLLNVNYPRKTNYDILILCFSKV